MKRKPYVSIVIPTRNRTSELKRLVESIKKSSYEEYEIITVNDSSEALALKTFPEIRVVNNASNKGLAFSRTKGAALSKGKYVLFIDDDNVVDKEMISLLVKSMENQKNLAAVGPINYFLNEPKKISFLGVNINLATSKANFFKDVSDSKLLNNELLLTGNLHNCFMVKRELGEDVGWFDEKLFMSGTEFDMFMRMKKKFTHLILATNLKAKCWHDVLELSYKKAKNFSASYASREKRLYYTQRNRGVLTGRYGSLLDKCLLAVFFYPLFTFLYIGIFTLKNCIGFAFPHIRGTISGYHHLMNGGKF